MRRLTARHIEFIAIGGAVGAGLFLGSGTGIAAAGPAILVTYAIAGLVVFLMARALGELLLERRPIPGSFAVYASEELGSWAGFVTGWSYWLVWTLVAVAELSAFDVLTRYWLPQLPQGLAGLSVFLVLYAINIAEVRLFGELEFWMALVKVLTISAFVAGGLLVCLIGGATTGSSTGFANLVSHGGFAPHGWWAVLKTLPLAMFVFGGVEMVGIAAADAEDPERTLPRAINGIVIRILIFYMGSLAIIMALVPWTEVSGAQSPYVYALQRLGLPVAALLINVVVLTAIASSCSSGIYATGRTLASLAQRGHATRGLQALNRRGVPLAAINVSAALMLVGVGLNVVSDKVFAGAVSAVAVLILWTWLIIALCHLFVRRREGAGRFPLPWYPYSNYLVFAVIAAVAILMAIDQDLRRMLYAGAVWMLLLTVAYWWFVRPRVTSEDSAG